MASKARQDLVEILQLSRNRAWRQANLTSNLYLSSFGEKTEFTEKSSIRQMLSTWAIRPISKRLRNKVVHPAWINPSIPGQLVEIDEFPLKRSDLLEISRWYRYNTPNCTIEGDEKCHMVISFLCQSHAPKVSDAGTQTIRTSRHQTLPASSVRVRDAPIVDHVDVALGIRKYQAQFVPINQKISGIHSCSFKVFSQKSHTLVSFPPVDKAHALHHIPNQYILLEGRQG
mmetsp:Transcript_4166/g.8033  ORF Transcript_4166/g.8033 Transcript_4166/m.8033 type:complete len:229 (-) Transcript_4166:4437-5123(-)